MDELNARQARGLDDDVRQVTLPDHTGAEVDRLASSGLREEGATVLDDGIHGGSVAGGLWRVKANGGAQRRSAPCAGRDG